MYGKLLVVIGAMAGGWMWSGYAHAAEPGNDLRTFEIAQSQGIGGPNPSIGAPPGMGGSIGSGAPGGMPAGQTPSTNNMGQGKGIVEQGEERRMQSDPATRRPPSSGSAGSTLGGGTSSSSSPSGSGTAGMGGGGGETNGTMSSGSRK